MPSRGSLVYVFATSHSLDALLAISSSSWPMPCASTKPSQNFSSVATRLATREFRSGGWSDAERLGEVVCESGWIRAGKSPDLIGVCMVTLNLFRVK